MIDDVIEILKNFSFTEAESRIYLAILALGKPSVSEVAKKVEMNRTAAYFHLKNLVSKGVLRTVKKEKTLHFAAMTPKEFGDRLQQLTVNFKSFVPELEVLNKVDRELPAVEVVEAKSGYIKVYEAIAGLPHGSFFRIIEGRRSFQDEVDLIGNEGLHKFFTEVVARKIVTKAIFTTETLAVPSDAISPENFEIFKKRLWNIRVLGEAKLPLKNPTLIYGDRVSFLFPEFSLVVTIRHQGVVDIITTIFDALFDFSGKVEKIW